MRQVPARGTAWVGAGVALASVLTCVPPAGAQQNWAPLITPADAESRPLPQPRAPTARTRTEALPTPTPAPAPRSDATATPLPFAQQRRAAGDVAVPSFTASLAPRPEPTPMETPLARAYCATIGTAAADAKFAWQKKALTEFAQDLEDRIAKLEAKTEEYRVWLARRDEFAKRAHESLVVIYSRMRSDAAALQLVAMDEETAAAVLIKLDPRVASTILNDMNPQHAARLTSIISGAGRTAPAPQAKTAPAPRPTPEDRKS